MGYMRFKCNLFEPIDFLASSTLKTNLHWDRLRVVEIPASIALRPLVVTETSGAINTTTGTRALLKE
jgi:hypothetical protein